MGWSSAGDIMDVIMKSSKKYIPDNKKRKEFYIKVIEVFEDHDWDTQDECMGVDKAFDLALKEIHPDWDRWEE